MTASIPERLGYLALAVATIAVGLSVHFAGTVLPSPVRDVPGDALWAVMVVWWMGVLAPRAPLWARVGAALAICVLVEASQAVRTPGLDAIRRTTPGHLVLGSDFDPRDFAAYAGGVVAAAIGERVIRRAFRR